MRVIFLRFTVGFVVLSFVGIPPAIAQPVAFKPPPIAIPDARQKDLLAQDIGQIKARLEYIALALRNAKADDGETIVVARKAIVATFKQYREPMYRYEVARQAAGIITPLLELKGVLRQVNVAMGLAKMPYWTIQPALAKMVAHANAGVRYLGWKGYRALIQLQGGKSLQTMLQLLKSGLVKETSPRVVGIMWDVLAMKSGGSGSAVSDKDRLAALAIITGSWRKRCSRVFAGDIAMTEAVGHGVRAAVWHAGMAKADKTRRDAARIVVDAMYCGAKALGSAFKAGELTSPRGMAAETLLWECEKALNDMLGLRHLAGENRIRGVLTNPTLRETLDTAIIRWVHPRTGKVYGVLGWVGVLQKKGIAVETPKTAMFKPAAPPPPPNKGNKPKPPKDSDKPKPKPTPTP